MRILIIIGALIAIGIVGSFLPEMVCNFRYDTPEDVGECAWILRN